MEIFLHILIALGRLPMLKFQYLGIIIRWGAAVGRANLKKSLRGVGDRSARCRCSLTKFRFRYCYATAHFFLSNPIVWVRFNMKNLIFPFRGNKSSVQRGEVKYKMRTQSVANAFANRFKHIVMHIR
jgi:hypothetical protein